MWLLKTVLGFLSGPLSDISNDLKEAYQSKLNAANDKERIAADERINLLEARKSIILAAQSDPFERWVRILFAVPFALYVWKLVVYDKILEWGATANLSTDLWNMFYIILGGYFVETTVRTFRR